MNQSAVISSRPRVTSNNRKRTAEILASIARRSIAWPIDMRLNSGPCQRAHVIHKQPHREKATPFYLYNDANYQQEILHDRVASSKRVLLSAQSRQRPPDRIAGSPRKPVTCLFSTSIIFRSFLQPLSSGSRADWVTSPFSVPLYHLANPRLLSLADFRQSDMVNSSFLQCRTGRKAGR